MTGQNISSVAIVGAASPIGRFLISRLNRSGRRFFAIGRRHRDVDGFAIHRFDDVARRFEPPIHEADAIINCAPLPTIGTALDMAACIGARRIIAFGSTGRFSKLNSSSPVERDFVNQQVEAEEHFKHSCRQQGIAWTLFRPTMIYGAGSDLNVAFIGKFILRFRFFPVPNGANGLRQPVHADDLAAACITALACERTFGRSYNLGGGERLLYAELVGRIFTALNQRPFILPIPLSACRRLARIVRKIPNYRFINPDMVDRTLVDLVADHSEAQSDFGYSPRKFFPTVNDIFSPLAA